jgi:glutamyl endopeptidase
MANRSRRVEVASIDLGAPRWLCTDPPPVLGATGTPDATLQTPGFMRESNGGGSLEQVPGFDSYRARNEGLLPRAPVAKRRPKTLDFERENVIGPIDTRVPVPDTTALPWRCIALLSITYESGATATGTAWFYGPRTLGTAGHNVRHAQHGRATSILVSPAYDGEGAPFGTYTAVQCHCHPRWNATASDDSLDYAVILLGADSPGRRLGWFGIAAYSRAQLLPLLVNVSGYAADLWPQTQYFDGGRLQEVTDAFLQYPFDTEVGMSGSPIFALFDQRRIVVGIHTGGSSRINRARRIDPELFAFLSRFL